MSISIEGTPTTVSGTATSTTHVFTYPTGVTLGEVIFFIGSENGQGHTFTSPNWVFTLVNSLGAGSMSFIYGWKIATGSETGNFTVTASNTGSMSGTVVRFSGVDTADPTNSTNTANTSVGSSQTDFTIAADTLTGMDSGSSCLVNFGNEGTGTTTLADADLVEIALINVNPGVNAFIDYDTESTGNAAYAMETTPARDYGIFLIEVKAEVTAAITGTITASTKEGDIVAGGKVIRITLTGDTFKAAGTGPIGTIAETQALIDGLTSDGSE